MSTQGLKISPRALALAKQNQMDLSQITPTGPDGRIIEKDVLRALEEQGPNVSSEPLKENLAAMEEHAEEGSAERMEDVMTENRKEEITMENIATQTDKVAIMAVPVVAVSKEEKTEGPKEEPKEKTYQYGTEAYRHTDVIISGSEKAPDGTPITISMSFDATAIVKLHQMIKENGEAMGLPHITINDMILFASAKILKKNKALNAHFLGDRIRYFEGVHLGFVVDTGHGMETPTVFDADRLSLSALSKITGTLIRGARAGGVSPEKNKLCASFMVTNLGTLGVESFTPALTAPQTGALGVCALQRRIKTIDGKDVSYPCIPLSLSFDPRALDTASAAKFLRELCASLENFELLLIK